MYVVVLFLFMEKFYLPHPMIAIKDIVKSAGLSHATVSCALRGDTPISTTERVVRLAKEMEYIPQFAGPKSTHSADLHQWDACMLNRL